MSKQIYEKVCNGDWINDIELRDAIKDFKAAENTLFKLGQSFEITRKAVTMTLITLEDIQRARRDK